MIILTIETSCDDTCVAVVRASGKMKPRFTILSNIISSQVKIHQKWGGVYPTLAKREHQKNLPIVFKKALKKAKIEKSEIDLIAVTIGPGLEPCLWVGVNFAKELARSRQIAIMPVNHIEAHILVNFVDKAKKIKGKDQIFPAVCLVVSGGHTQLILMRKFGKYRILGETRDDAAGECFDKTARILGLSYPGGPAIAAQAGKLRHPMSTPRGHRMSKHGFRDTNSLPRPMINQKNYDFSFSGLKTAVLYNYKKQSPKTRKSKKYIQEMATEIQQAIIDVLIKKTLRAAKNYKAKTIILGGGVSANKELRKQLKEKIKKEMPDTKYLIPDTKYCTDNAVMMGITAYYNWILGKKIQKKIKAEANLRLT